MCILIHALVGHWRRKDKARIRLAALSPPGFDNIQRIGREVHLDTGGFVVAVVLGLLWRFGQSAKIRV